MDKKIMMNQFEIVWMDPRELIPYENNPRQNDDAVEPVACSIEEFGWRQPIVVEPDKVIIIGHTRWKAAIQRQWTEVPVHIAKDLTLGQIKALRLADNRTGEIATWDLDLLALEMKQLEAMDFNMDNFGFSELELSQIMQEHDPVAQGKTAPDDVPIIDEPPISQRGTVYQCGAHRVMCGDSTDKAELSILMHGATADLWLTDPPYNVDYESANGLKIQNDRMNGPAFDDFLIRSFTAAALALRPGASFYIFHSDNWGYNFRQAVIAAGLTLRQCLIWAKNGFILGRQDYQWAHEACLYGWRDGAPHSWYGDRRQSTVIADLENHPFIRREDGRLQFRIGGKTFSIAADAVCEEEATTIIEYPKPKRNDIHPTMKPVELLIYLLKNSCTRGEIIMDPFGGSGSTLIAAEQTGRIAYLMELDERYVDVIRKRYAEFKYGAGCNWQALTPPMT